MIVRPSEFGMIQQMDNVSQVKQFEDSRPVEQQQNLVQQMNREVDNRHEQVQKKDGADNANKKFDARDKSDNEYSGQQSAKDKKKKPDGKFFIKGQGGSEFDIKI